MRRYIPCAVMIALLLAALAGCRPTTLTAEESHELLRDIRKAHRTLAVKGEVVTRIRLRGEMISADARIHRGRGRMQLEFISGKAAGAQIVQQQGSVWQISPDGETVRKLPHNPLDTMPRPGKNTQVTVARGSTIAGRATRRVTVKPARQSQARLEIWADKENNFPLRMDRYNAGGELVSSTRYKEVSFSTEAPKAVELQGRASPNEIETAKIDKQQAAELLGQDPVVPEYVPAGFDFQGYYRHHSRRGEIVALRYSDGVRLLTILQMQQPEEVAKAGAGADTAEAPSRPERATRTGARREIPNAQRPGGPAATAGSAERGERRDDRRASPRRDAAGTAEEPPAGGERDETTGRLPGAEMHRNDRAGRPAAGMRPEEDGQVWRDRLRGRMMRLHRDGLVIVVLGDLPTPQLRRVAAGLRESAIDF
ncbi:MAG: sigma-E factor regulatory protein RseB domain-containing protein [Armatimonadota bacterium]